ncbi:MAG TPA: hypothetical protein VH599_19685 [Ktedonobacterales bacterium]
MPRHSRGKRLRAKPGGTGSGLLPVRFHHLSGGPLVAPPSRRLDAAPGRACARQATGPAGQRWPPGWRRYKYSPQPLACTAVSAANAWPPGKRRYR